MRRLSRLARIAFLIAGISILGVGCNRPTGQNLRELGARAWIDAPLHESMIPMDSYQIVIHGSHIAGVEKFELTLDGEFLTEIDAQQVSETLAMGERSWLPPGPGEYLLEVRAMNNLGEWGEYDQAVVRVLGEESVELDVDPLILTPSTATLSPMTETPTPTMAVVTPEDVCVEPVMLKATRNLNCRAGSNPAFLIVGSFLKGETAVVEAFNPSRSWAYIENPSFEGDYCWVWMNYTEIHQGDPDCSSVRQDPPTPTPSRTPIIPTLTSTPDTPVPPPDTQKPDVNVGYSPGSPNENTQISISASASDNVGVKRIELYFFKQGQSQGSPVKVCNNTTSCSQNLGFKSSGNYTVRAVAYDAADNSRTKSSNLTVSVVLY